LRFRWWFWAAVCCCGEKNADPKKQLNMKKQGTCIKKDAGTFYMVKCGNPLDDIELMFYYRYEQLFCFEKGDFCCGYV